MVERGIGKPQALNICIFSRAFYPAVGGLEHIAQLLATEIARLGYAVEVVTDTPGISKADDQQFPFRIVRTRYHGERVLAFKRADAVLFMNVTLHGMRAALMARTPVVFSHHGIYEGEGLLGRFLELLKRQLTLLYPNISVSEFVSRRIPGQSTVIPNAYDNAMFVRPVAPKRDREFIFCGRLVSDKGADMCVRAFAQVLECVQDSTLTLIGDGPERPALESLVEHLGISARVHFAGTLRGQELAAELQRHASMVVPSLCQEAFGIVALEGIACCDTIIATNRGGLPEAVGNCGLVVEPTVDDLAAGMISVAKARRAGEILPGEVSDDARKTHLAAHTPETVAQRYLDVIEQAISRRAIRGGA